MFTIGIKYNRGIIIKVFVSVIIPVYNTDKYLKQCVDSVLNQTFKDFELILVNDGSVDGSAKICDFYSKQDQRVKVIHQKNAGQTKARQAGLKISTGEYILFVDSDDWIDNNLLELTCNSAKKEKADIVTFNIYFEYGDRRVKIKQPVPSGIFDKEGLINNIYSKMIYSGRFFYYGIQASMANKLFKRLIVMPNVMGLSSGIKIGEDGVTTYSSFLDASKVVVLGDRYLYHNRNDNVSITRSYCEGQFDSALLLTKTLYEMNKQKNIYDLTDQINYYLMYHVHSIFIEEFLYRHKRGFVSRFKYLRKIAQNNLVQEVCRKMPLTDMVHEPKLFFEFLKSGRYNAAIAIAILAATKTRLKSQIKKYLKK